MPLGNNLQRLRTKYRFSRAALAAATKGKVSGSWIAQVESGEIASPSFDKLSVVAEVLNTTVDYLINGGDYDEPVKSDVILDHEFVLRVTLPVGATLTDDMKVTAQKIMKSVIDELATNRAGNNNEQSKNEDREDSGPKDRGPGK